MESNLNLHHVCIRVSNLRKSEVFYQGFLGLEKLREFTVAAEDAQTLLNISQECHFMDFAAGPGRLEIFTTTGAMPLPAPGNHFCLALTNREKLLQRLIEANITVRETMREGRQIVFIHDPDNNVLELKETDA